MKTTVTCNVCRNDQCNTVATLHSEIDGNVYQAVECRNCGLVFTSPLPQFSLEQLQNVYGENYTEEQRKIGTADNLVALRAATASQMQLVEQYIQKGTALNVGAMGPAVTTLIERGWKLHVVDASRYAAETAHEQWGLDVTVSLIEDFRCPPGSFDFVKLGHVIEHLCDPRIVIEQLAAMLRPGGILLIDTDNAKGFKTRVEVLIRRCLGERLSGALVRSLLGKNLSKRYGRLTPPEHLYAFSERSLSQLVRGAGFEVLQVFTPAWGDKTWFPLPHTTRFSLVERLFLFIDRLGATFGSGEVLVVLARKQ